MRAVCGAFLGASLAMIGAAPGQAGGVALVLGGEAGVDEAVTTLETVGFEVFSASDPDSASMRSELAALHGALRAEDAAHVVVVLTGVFAHAPHGGWLLGSEADRPALALADGQGLRLDTVMQIAAEAGTGALVWLGEEVAAREFGLGLRAGLPDAWDLPDGLGLVTGTPADVGAALGEALQPGAPLGAALERRPGLALQGALDPRAAFLPQDFAPLARADQRAFEAAVEADTEEAFAAYLAAYPNGMNAQAARAEIERIRTAPDRIEAELFLTAEERRAIQRDLSVLGYDTRGIDGIFGPGTRGSIAGWQELGGREPTGYLTREQILALAEEAAERSAEIEAEARAQREAEERADREFWAMTGAAGDGPGLRSYLERYPEGIFAALAQARLEQLAEAERAAAREREVEAWRRARRIDSVASYEAFLRDWPEGEFAELAQARIDERRPAPDAGEDAATAPDTEPPEGAAEMQARATEAALGLNRPTRLLIEQRLVAMGLDPGPVDGVFDARTRAAIRAAQAQFDHPATGYVDEALMNRMMQGLLRSLFD